MFSPGARTVKSEKELYTDVRLGAVRYSFGCRKEEGGVVARESMMGGASNDGDGEGVRSVGEREKDVDTKYRSLNASTTISVAHTLR
jgi:hypothetical protein